MDRCLFFIFQLLLLVSCSKSDVSLIDLVKEDYTSYLYGPVQINGHVVNLMIDTGANTTVIDAAKAKEMNLSPSDTCSAHVSLVKGEWAGTCYSRETEIKIGDIEMSCNLFFANYNESLPVDLGPWPFDGILGMDVMTRLNWFVDLKNSQLWLSTGRMDYPIKQTPDFTLEMRRGEMAYTSVVLCDSVEHKVLFDTGYFKKVILNGYELTPTLVLLDSILNQCKSDTAGTCYMSFEDMEWLIYDSLKIGNLSLPYVLLDNSKRERSERYVGLLTCNFLSYFDYMAYDREKERIYLYNYNDDIAETQEMKDFYHKIRKAYRGEIELKELLKKE